MEGFEAKARVLYPDQGSKARATFFVHVFVGGRPLSLGPLARRDLALGRSHFCDCRFSIRLCEATSSIFTPSSHLLCRIRHRHTARDGFLRHGRRAARLGNSSDKGGRQTRRQFGVNTASIRRNACLCFTQYATTLCCYSYTPTVTNSKQSIPWEILFPDTLAPTHNVCNENPLSHQSHYSKQNPPRHMSSVASFQTEAVPKESLKEDQTRTNQ